MSGYHRCLKPEIRKKKRKSDIAIHPWRTPSEEKTRFSIGIKANQMILPPSAQTVFSWIGNSYNTCESWLWVLKIKPLTLLLCHNLFPCKSIIKTTKSFSIPWSHVSLHWWWTEWITRFDVEENGALVITYIN